MEGGNANSYVYPSDPKLASDATGNHGYLPGAQSERWCAKHPFVCPSIIAWAEKSVQEAHKMSNEHNVNYYVVGDSLQHYMWMFMTGWYVGFGKAIDLGERFENDETPSGQAWSADSYRDYWNDVAGAYDGSRDGAWVSWSAWKTAKRDAWQAYLDEYLMCNESGSDVIFLC